MTIYISIPMTGRDTEAQRAKAKEIQEKLTAKGISTINPFDLAEHLRELFRGEDKPTEAEYLQHDITILKRHADAIFMCDTWEQSFGCKQELMEAIKKGLIIYLENSYIL